MKKLSCINKKKSWNPLYINRSGGLTDLFLFIIIAFIVVICSGIFLYIAVTTTDTLHDNLDSKSTSTVNYTSIINETIEYVPLSYQVLKWGSAVLIFGMILSIFYGSYKVTTKPIYFIPYIIIVIMAIILSVVVANAYEELLDDSQLASTLKQFTASNFMLLYLPYIVTVVGFVGGIIMFASYSIQRQQESIYFQ